MIHYVLTYFILLTLRLQLKNAPLFILFVFSLCLPDNVPVAFLYCKTEEKCLFSLKANANVNNEYKPFSNN